MSETKTKEEMSKKELKAAIDDLDEFIAAARQQMNTYPCSVSQAKAEDMEEEVQAMEATKTELENELNSRTF